MRNGPTVQEFNIQTDPEAAHIVFESGVPVTMVPLEVRTYLALETVESSLYAILEVQAYSYPLCCSCNTSACNLATYTDLPQAGAGAEACTTADAWLLLDGTG
jgi:inosine-uridine nucleoside N-ribohydrolase